jgi:diguanylate cyclase (GGDEF)-like protein/PAS domain S-box-containing protein
VADTCTGNVRHVWSLKFPVRDAEGRITGLGGVSLDVTDRERAARELAAARALSDAMFASAPVGMLVSRDHDDGTTEIVQCNAAFARMLGHEPSDLLGSVGPVIVHPDDLPIRARLLENIRAGLPASAEVRYIHRNGQEICTLTGLSLVHGPEGERLIVVQSVDISERKDLELRLQHQADRDALTGLFSRRRFLEELEREVVRSRRYERIGALLLLDLDGFKQVNDSFGHATGDDLLIRIGDALRACLRESDVLARIGGDEFAAILPDTNADGARSVAAKLIAAVRANGGVAVDTRRADVTASVGITLVTGTALLNAAELLSQADVAMYWAKDSGKARFAVYARGGAIATG